MWFTELVLQYDKPVEKGGVKLEDKHSLMVESTSSATHHLYSLFSQTELSTQQEKQFSVST